MKSQDILLLLKLVSLWHGGRAAVSAQAASLRAQSGSGRYRDANALAQYSVQDKLGSALSDAPGQYQYQYASATHSPPMLQNAAVLAPHPQSDTDTDTDSDSDTDDASPFSMRALAEATGISKSQVSLALHRCYDAGLAKLDRKTGVPRANTLGLGEFIVHGLRYVFPAKPGALARGLPTAIGAPVLLGKLMTAGDSAPVWPCASGEAFGQAVAPLFKSVPEAAQKDPRLYAMLALADSIRIGLARERNFASEKLLQILKESE